MTTSSREHGAEAGRSTISMKSGGYYSEHTQGAKDVIDTMTPQVLSAVAQMEAIQAGTGAVTIVDYGAADGGTSADMMRKLIGVVRQRAPRRPIQIVYTDLPGNDYSALFRWLHGEQPGVRSYLVEHRGVYVCAAGTSFYQQVLPPGCVHLGFSATAMHWLSRKPMDIADHVHAVGASGSTLDAFRKQGLADWETILLQRARELLVGGHLVMANFCIDEQGRYLGHTGGVNMFDTFAELWLSLQRDGVINAEEYRAATFPQYYRTLEECCAPFQDESSPVFRAGLRLNDSFTRIVPCPYAASYRQHRDARRFADAYVPTLRSWSETVFLHALDPGRSEAERRDIVDSFYNSYHQRVLAGPEEHSMDYVHAYLSVERIDVNVS